MGVRVPHQEWSSWTIEERIDFVQEQDHETVYVEGTDENWVACRIDDTTACQTVRVEYASADGLLVNCIGKKISKTRPPDDCSNCPLHP